MEGKGSRKKASVQVKGDTSPEALAPRSEPPPRPEPAARLEPPRLPIPQAPSDGSAPPVVEAGTAQEVEHRQFPRARLATRFELWIDEERERRFTASLRSANVSVGGAFLESTFFLPLNTEFRVRFALQRGAAPVEARARVVREQRAPQGEEPSGFGIHFEEFYGQTEVSLARLFLDTRLRTFAEDYLRSQRARGLSNELERVVDALAAWELLKAHHPKDSWGGE